MARPADSQSGRRAARKRVDRAKANPAEPAADDGRRGQLIRESARLFRKKGYDATSVRDIAAAAGIQSGSWVYHFSTKQDILVAVMEEGLERALARIEGIVGEDLPARDKFRKLVRTHLETILAPGEDFLPVLLYEWRSLDSMASRPRIVALQNRYESVWDEVMQDLVRSGDWAGPTRIDRLLMFGALNWMARWYRPTGGLDIDDLTDECSRFLLRTPETRRRPRTRSAAAKKRG